MFACPPDPYRTARDLAYLSLGLRTSVVAFAVWITALSLSLTLAVLIIGLPVIIGSAYVMRWTAELDSPQRGARLRRPGARRLPRAPLALDRGPRAGTLRDPQVWRDPAWLITHSVVGFAFGVIAVTLVGTRRRTGDAPPGTLVGSDGVEMGLWNLRLAPAVGDGHPRSWPPRWRG